MLYGDEFSGMSPLTSISITGAVGPPTWDALLTCPLCTEGRGTDRISPSSQQGPCRVIPAVVLVWVQLLCSCHLHGDTYDSTELQVSAGDPQSLRWVALEEQHMASLPFLCSALGHQQRQPKLQKHSCSSEHAVTAGTALMAAHRSGSHLFRGFPAMLGPNCSLAPCMAAPQSHSLPAGAHSISPC